MEEFNLKGNLYITPDISSVTLLKSIFETPCSTALIKTSWNAGTIGFKFTSSDKNPNFTKS